MHDALSSLASRSRCNASSIIVAARHVALTSMMLAVVATVGATAAAAQGYPGGGMGGMGGMGGGGMGGRSRGGMGGRRGGGAQPGDGPNTGEMVKQMKELGRLKDALHDVNGLTNPQKDSLGAIEKSYARIFESYGVHLLNMLDSARSAGGPPDFTELRSLRATTDSVRGVELGAARAVLSTDEQRARFDENVAKLRDDEAKREEEMQRRRRRG